MPTEPAPPSSPPLLWRHRRGVFDLTKRGLVMGVLNVTPDSFSDGGLYASPESALRHARRLEDEGADILDIGGESTRPGATPVEAEEELRRVLPVLRAVRARSDIVISIDTSKAVVAEEAMRAGADIINDITGLTGDLDMLAVARRWQAGVVVMHMRGRPATMQQAPAYEDVVAEVGQFLRQQALRLVESGMPRDALVLDPGIGFGKTPEHNRLLLRATPRLASLGWPLLLGVSRKSFLGWLAGAADMQARFWPGVAITALGRKMGARIFRVHEPAPHRQALRMVEALLDA